VSRVKIVATIGPATANEAALKALRDAGMGIARLNGSHSDLDWHRKTIALIRGAVPGVAILLDIPGRKIRTTGLAHEPSFKAGDVVVLTTDTSHDGKAKVPVNYDRLHEDLKPGHVVLADDGTLRFTVQDVRGRDIHCRAETPGTLKSRKGINVPFVKLGTALVTDRDRQMTAFARETGVDFVGISFVESAAHVRAIQELIGASSPRIVSKVENQGGVENLKEIMEATDAAMIDRGDLSVETSLDTLTLFQKRIIEAAREAAKPVIVATEMLHTMIENDFPTKAEVSDITNAVLDGCSAVMLSGETAVGRHPVAAVRTMRQIADAAEQYLQERLDGGGTGTSTVPRAMGDAIALICRSLPITKIVAVTRSGYAARTVAARQVRQPIIAVSDDVQAARAFNLLPGVTGEHVDVPFVRGSTDHIIRCLEALWRRGRIDTKDMILVTAVGYPRSGNRMNLVQTHSVADLIEALGWTK
jgi:pyruvate kinase